MVKLKEIKKVRFHNFIYIEFEYQNSSYNHDSMSQVHLFFKNLLFLGFACKNGMGKYEYFRFGN